MKKVQIISVSFYTCELFKKIVGGKKMGKMLVTKQSNRCLIPLKVYRKNLNTF